MGKYTDDEIRSMPKITAKIAADYLGISPMMVTLGMRNNVLPIGFGQVLFSIPWFRSLVLGSPSLIGYWLSLRCPFVVYNTPCHSRL